MKYKVVEHWNTTEFGTLVTLYISEGWSLVGGVCVILERGGGKKFYQAMTR